MHVKFAFCTLNKKFYGTRTYLKVTGGAKKDWNLSKTSAPFQKFYTVIFFDPEKRRFHLHLEGNVNKESHRY